MWTQLPNWIWVTEEHSDFLVLNLWRNPINSLDTLPKNNHKHRITLPCISSTALLPSTSLNFCWMGINLGITFCCTLDHPQKETPVQEDNFNFTQIHFGPHYPFNTCYSGSVLPETSDNDHIESRLVNDWRMRRSRPRLQVGKIIIRQKA